MALVAALVVVMGDGPAFDGTVRVEEPGRESAFMIPPPCPAGTPCKASSSHCASISVLPGGAIALGWFSGYREGWDLTGIAVATLPPNGSQWTASTIVSQHKGFSRQNPVLHYDKPRGSLTVFHAEQPSRSKSEVELVGAGGDPVPNQESLSTMWYTAAALPATAGKVTTPIPASAWATPTQFDPTRGTWPRNQVVLALDGSWLVPVYNESLKTVGHQDEYSFIFKKPASAPVAPTSSGSWTKIPFNNSGYLVQPSVIRLKVGEPALRVYYRDRRAQFIYTATSADDGASWTSPVATQLPNNNAGVHAERLASGAVVVAYNNMTGSLPHDLRWSLVVSISDDGGVTFTNTRVLELHPPTAERQATAASSAVVWAGSADGVGGIGPTSCECYSYPWVTQGPDGVVHIAYTFQRRTIKYNRVTEAWLRAK